VKVLILIRYIAKTNGPAAASHTDANAGPTTPTLASPLPPAATLYGCCATCRWGQLPTSPSPHQSLRPRPPLPRMALRYVPFGSAPRPPSPSQTPWPRLSGRAAPPDC